MLLLHGLGATGGVWRGFDGLAPDLPGHGTARWDDTYTFTRPPESLMTLHVAHDLPVVTQDDDFEPVKGVSGLEVVRV